MYSSSLLHVSPPFFAVAICVDAFGVVSNGFILGFLHFNRIGSQLTTTLMKSQFVFDGLLSLWAALSLVITDEHFDWAGPLSAFFCYTWVSRALFWFLVMLSECNLTCIAFDRLRSLVFPATYRHREKLSLGLYYAVTFVYALLNGLTSVFTVRYSEERGCRYIMEGVMSPWELAYDRFTALLWLFTAYLIPGILMLVSNSWVMLTVRGIVRKLHRSGAPVSNTASGVENSAASDGNCGGSTAQNSGLWIFVPAVAMWLAFSTTHAYQVIYNILIAFQVVPYRAASIERRVGTFLTVVNSACNPLIVVVSSPPFRRRLRAFTEKCCLCRRGKLGDNIDVSRVQPG